MTFATPKGLGRWLKVNHATESELWVKIFKKKTGIPSVTWDDVVIESLSCVASEMKVPADFLVALENKPKAKQFFETLNKSNRYAPY